MNCSKARKLLMDYLCGSLRQEMSPAMEKHLQACATCRKESLFLQNYRRALEIAPDKKAPADFLERLRRRLNENAPAPGPFFPLLRALGAASALAVLALFIFGTGIWRNEKSARNMEKKILSLEKATPLAPKSRKAGLFPSNARKKQSAPAEAEKNMEKKGKDREQAELFLILTVSDGFATTAAGSAAMDKTSENLLEKGEAKSLPSITAKPKDGLLAGKTGEIKKILAELGGQVFSEAPGGEGKDPEMVIEVPADKYDKFLEKLKEMGVLHEPEYGFSRAKQEKVRIRLRIIS
ncbi:MAG: hypothetical protein ACM3WV_09360 [Bacillota bacterium]